MGQAENPGDHAIAGRRGGRALSLPGFEADLAIIDGNPLHNLKTMYGIGIEVVENGKLTRRGGVKFTIKDGVVFDAPALLADVREMVKEARAQTTAP